MPKTNIGITYGAYKDSDSRGPKGRKKRANSLHHAIRINDQLKDVLEVEKHPHERYNDIILRLLKERTEQIARYRNKAEALEEELAARYRMSHG